MKILVVDDDEIALAVVKKILENDKYEVVLAEDGDSALEILRSNEIRVVISDWNMPKVTGIELCRQIRATITSGYTYFILVSARSSKEDLVQGLSAGADDFISKPFEPAELLARVHTAERVVGMDKNIRQSEGRNLALLGAIPDAIFRVRADGIILDYKASSNDLLGVTSEAVVGSGIGKILSESATRDAMECINNALTKKEMQGMEFTQVIRGSSHVFEARIKDSGDDEVTAIVRDISERARLDQMKSDFINKATHELRTPIATMVLMVNLLEGVINDEENLEYWTVLKSELQRERTLVEDLLSAGRLESNQVQMNFRYIDIAEVLKDTLRQIGPTTKAKNIAVNLQVNSELDEASCFVNGDETSLTQVFINLLGNAVKFTPSGGRIDVTVKPENDGVQVTVADTGIGIPSEDIPLLFNRFFRGTNAIQDEVPGTGIGLYIVRAILDKHHGTIKVHSRVGKGSHFNIWLPTK